MKVFICTLIIFITLFQIVNEPTPTVVPDGVGGTPVPLESISTRTPIPSYTPYVEAYPAPILEPTIVPLSYPEPAINKIENMEINTVENVDLNENIFIKIINRIEIFLEWCYIKIIYLFK